MREQYLKAMGIQPWFLRTETTEAPNMPCYALQLKKEGNLVGILLAESEKKDKAVSKMLWNICQALKLEAAGEWYANMPDFSLLLTQCQFVIAMGEFSDIYQNVEVIKTFPPKRLLSEPGLKREAWHALQKALVILASPSAT